MKTCDCGCKLKTKTCACGEEYTLREYLDLPSPDGEHGAVSGIVWRNCDKCNSTMAEKAEGFDDLDG